VATEGKGSRTSKTRRGSAARGSSGRSARWPAIDRAQPVAPVPVATIRP
jgi:hypothetical protein